MALTNPFVTTLDEIGPPSEPLSVAETIWRVAEINRAVRTDLERKYADIWIQGEISDLTVAASGHGYFTLNDAQEPAQLRVVIFRSDLRKCATALKDGEAVKVRGTLSLYQARGSFQMIARYAEALGAGDLRLQFEKLKAKLMSEGLTDPARKRALPKFPRKIGVVTSRSGAALHDIIQVASARCAVHIVVSHCLVQGMDAPASIVCALEQIQEVLDIEVVIVGRGGGSAEDLFAFNDETVARAIARCRVPIVSAVGHEVDITIADFVADVRAATPSNAAELVVPDRQSMGDELSAVQRHLEQAMALRVGQARVRLERALRALKQPAQVLAKVRALLAELYLKLSRHSPRQVLAARKHQLLEYQSRLAPTVYRRLTAERTRLSLDAQHVTRAQKAFQAKRTLAFAELNARLTALSPLAVLERGYALVFKKQDQALLRSVDQIALKEEVSIHLHKGSLEAVVNKKTP